MKTSDISETLARTRVAHRRGFTLLEILVVMGIVLLLLSLAVVAVGPMLSANKLRTGGAMVVDELNLARQLALTKNQDVEVRFYSLGTTFASDAKRYRAFQTYFRNAEDPTKSTPVGALKQLPDAIVLSDKATASPLLDTTRTAVIKGQETLPSFGKSDYVAFYFRASGGTNLVPVDPPDGNWYVTLQMESAADNSTTGVPDNYFTAQVDPVTGRVRSYRP